MAAAVLNITWWIWRVLKPSWLFGPIFDKELRVSSRRKRNYVLRSVYLAVLTIFVVLVWVNATDISSGSSSVYRVSRMSQAGKIIISVIIWFQFCATQLLAVVMLSNAISDEIYHKTLGVLMTTPINSFQIVMGKLFSKLWQLLILLAVSIPLLAIVRVFGGVPWEFVISSICINLTAIIFAGSVSIYFSIRTKRAYAVILWVLFVGGVLYVFLPGIILSILHVCEFSGSVVKKTWVPVMVHANPFAALGFNTGLMLNPPRGAPFFSWPLHCGIMLAVSSLVLGLTIRAVRKVALRQATGEAGVFVKRKNRRAQKKAEHRLFKIDIPAGKIRRVNGSPIIWKELRAPMLKGGKTVTIIKIAVAVIMLSVTYLLFAIENNLHDDDVHAIYGVILVILGIITTATLAATSITSEKEARSWPILLATPLSEWHIIAGKAFGIFRRCLPVWLLLAGHVIIFTAVGYIHPVAIVHMAVLAVWIVVFFTGTGLYFSSRFKRTTPAVVANMGFALILWAILPMLFGLVTEIFDIDDDIAEFCISGNPVFQAGALMEGSAHRNQSLADLDYHWPDNCSDGVIATSVRVVIPAVFYMFVGVFFAWLAKRRLRRNIF